MSLLEDLNNVIARSQAPKCKVCHLLENTPYDEADAIRNAISSRVGADKIAAILRKHGHDVGRPSIVKHRDGNHE